jgi:hypothetical protein
MNDDGVHRFDQFFWGRHQVRVEVEGVRKERDLTEGSPAKSGTLAEKKIEAGYINKGRSW